ncbi:SPOR domain-containing protein [Palleronia abyssalis]|uniref:SPOR domain-containing protein n=1 Tax=Palleronia abyssalis TaxID=1501240 RepID=A0A2R8BY34_9RHOB|nr:SPOR domain-containing protein [Palleronia abyssalis]SPJ25061.1 hypothetical protein PAA8504_02905 [Palleronia abyssalis]
MARRSGKSYRLICVAVAALGVLSGCVGSGSGTAEEDAVRPSTTQRLVERDVEAPEVFQAMDRGVWDGRPSLGGVWVAHPETDDPERVIIRNEENGQFVIGALFRREPGSVGPTAQVSSDAAEALGMLAGTPAMLNITALRREEAPGAAPSEPVAAPAGLPDASPIAESALDEPPVIESSVDPVPAAPPSSLAKPFIQIGIFSEEQNARNTATSLEGIGADPTVNREETAGKVFYRVVVGPAASEAARAELLTKVKGLGFQDAYFVSG